MAFKQVMGGTGRKSSDLAIGESIEGYLLGTEESKFSFAIKLMTKENKVETLFPNGNLSYIEAEIEVGNVFLNQYTKITRTGTRQSNKSRDPQTGEWRQVPVFSVLQDAEDTIDAADAKAALDSDKASAAEATAGGPTSAAGSKFANRKR